MRLAVYCDYSYRQDDGTLWAELAFARFLAGLAPHLEHLTLVGRLDLVRPAGRPRGGQHPGALSPNGGLTERLGAALAVVGTVSEPTTANVRRKREP